VIAGDLRPDEAIVRFDPVVERALQFAIGEAVVFVSGDVVFLTDKGQEFVKRLMKQKDCMIAEKQFLSAVGRKLTQLQVESFLATEAQ
jgi:urease gamma subunit